MITTAATTTRRMATPSARSAGNEWTAVRRRADSAMARPGISATTPAFAPSRSDPIITSSVLAANGRQEVDVKRLIVFGMLLLSMLAACSAPATDAVRTIDVTMTDDLRYDPAAISVTAGETVRFVVHNEGAAVHEFLIGTEEEQASFEAEMSDGHGDGHGDEDGVGVDPCASG